MTNRHTICNVQKKKLELNEYKCEFEVTTKEVYTGVKIGTSDVTTSNANLHSLMCVRWSSNFSCRNRNNLEVNSPSEYSMLSNPCELTCCLNWNVMTSSGSPKVSLGERPLY